MSTIRFVHTDHLRLATPLRGIANAPTWLQKLVSDSVRHAVRNVIETAINQQASFLFIAGSVCDNDEDLPIVTRWLAEQFAPLKRAGIQVVAVTDDHRTQTALAEICDVAMSRTESLHVSRDTTGRVHLSTHPNHDQHAGHLVISAAHQSIAHAAELQYHAVPAQQPTTDSVRTSEDGYLSLSAGAVQTIAPAESWDCGCLVVDADLSSRHLSAQPQLCNPLRFTAESMNLRDSTSVDRLVSEISQASRSLQRASGQTIVVDWTVNAHQSCDVRELKDLDEQHLLNKLRNDLQAGHQGVWPRSLNFSERSDLQLTNAQGAAEEEYVDLLTGSVNMLDSQRTTAHFAIQGGSGVAAELVAGLQLLNRAA